MEAAKSANSKTRGDTRAASSSVSQTDIAVWSGPHSPTFFHLHLPSHESSILPPASFIMENAAAAPAKTH